VGGCRKLLKVVRHTLSHEIHSVGGPEDPGLMRGPGRIARGLLTDPDRPVAFRFDGRRMQGLEGDTLASALLANGKRLIARSFKYHRPRGIVTAGPEEPCALVDVIDAEGREPNRLATTLALHEGLVAESQNRWPSLRFDGAGAQRSHRPLPACGFLLQDVHGAGLGLGATLRAADPPGRGLGSARGDRRRSRSARRDRARSHGCGWLVGAGAAGLAAAYRLGASGLRVMLTDQDVVLGGGSLLDARWTAWRESLCAGLAGLATVRCLPRTTVLGAYGHGVFGALETLSPAEATRFGGLRERLRIIRARRVVFATGALERLIAFPGNDLPGVMLAGAALKYLRRYGVAVGRRPAFFLNTDEAYEAVFALTGAGIECAGVIDVRESSLAAERVRALGVEVQGGAVVEGACGRHGFAPSGSWT